MLTSTQTVLIAADGTIVIKIGHVDENFITAWCEAKIVALQVGRYCSPISKAKRIQ